MRQAAQIAVVGIEASCRLPLGAFDLGQFHLRGNRADDTRGDLILQFKDVIQSTFETLRPKVSAGARVDQLSCDADTVYGSAYAAFQQIAHAKLLPDLPHVRSA